MKVEILGRVESPAKSGRFFGVVSSPGFLSGSPGGFPGFFNVVVVSGAGVLCAGERLAQFVAWFLSLFSTDKFPTWWLRV